MNERHIAARMARTTLIATMAMALAIAMVTWKMSATQIPHDAISHSAYSVAAQFKRVSRFSAQRAEISRHVLASLKSDSAISSAMTKPVSDEKKTAVLDKVQKQAAVSENTVSPPSQKTAERQQAMVTDEKGTKKATDEGTTSGLAGALSKGSGSAKAARQGDQLASVIAAIKAEIERNKIYPRRARQAGMQGTVMLEISIAADGRISSVTIGKENRSALLNQAALSAAKGVTYIRTELKRALTVEVPVVFSLEKDN